MNFTNKVVIITGASSGIGAAAAEHLSKLGGKLVITGRNEVNLKKTAGNCKGEVLVVVSDMTVGSDREKIVKETIKKFGKIDVLVNNAGIGGGGEFASIPMEQFDSIMNTNVRSIFHLTQLVVPYLIKTQGNIVNISSMAGIRSLTGASVYCMSKAALDQFTKCIALELAPKNVRVNSVNPAVIDTDFGINAGQSKADLVAYMESAKLVHPLGRVGNVDDTSNAIAFLACNGLSSFTTGTLLLVDGGRAIATQR